MKLLLATRNRHKVTEIEAILGARFECSSLAGFPTAPEVVEDAQDFEGNAGKKAVELARWILRTQAEAGGLGFVLADDSGLMVDALGGAPGVHSARFAALESGALGNARDADNNAKLLRLLRDVPAANRTARFRCVIAVVALRGCSEAAPAVQYFQGDCLGTIGFAPGGAGGFGYDPLFTPDGYSQTFAELGEATKNQISHRARALQSLRTALEAKVTNR